MRASKLGLMAAALIAACGGGSGGEGNGGGGAAWQDADCAELGAVPTSNGGCYRACSSAGDCPGGATCFAVGYQPYCRMYTCGVASDCGTAGWACSYGNCFLSCTEPSPGHQSEECPSGFECYQNPVGPERWCTKIIRVTCGFCSTCYSSCSSSCSNSSDVTACLGLCWQGCDECCIP